MTVVSVGLSPEQLTSELEKAAGDVLVEQQLAAREIAPRTEMVSAFTDSLHQGIGVLPGSGLAPTLGHAEQVSLFKEVKDRTVELWQDIREWSVTVFRSSEKKIEELAKKIMDLAQKLKVSVEHLIARLYRRVMTALIENSVLLPFVVGEGNTAVKLSPSELTYSYTVKSAPSLGTLDLTGVVKLLSGLLEMEMGIEVKYAAGAAT